MKYRLFEVSNNTHSVSFYSISNLLRVGALRDHNSLFLLLSVPTIGSILDAVVTVRVIIVMSLLLDAHFVDDGVDSLVSQTIRIRHLTVPFGRQRRIPVLDSLYVCEQSRQHVVPSNVWPGCVPALVARLHCFGLLLFFSFYVIDTSLRGGGYRGLFQELYIVFR